MVKAEFHCHTCYSKDSLVTNQDLLDICQQKGIQRLVDTDHNSIEGALEARSLDLGRFIVGEEIMTTQGELLGFL
jgi:predicted metal-dependent phosphoesterase TrpH